MLAATVEYLDLTMQGIPRVKSFAAMTAPTAFFVRRSEGLELVENGGPRDPLARHSLSFGSPAGCGDRDIRSRTNTPRSRIMCAFKIGNREIGSDHSAALGRRGAG